MKTFIRYSLAVALCVLTAACTKPSAPANSNGGSSVSTSSPSPVDSSNDFAQRSNQNTDMGRHSIVGVQSGKCLDIADNSQAWEARVQLWSCTPENMNQKFDITIQSDGSYVLKLAHTGYCLEVANAETTNDAPLEQYPCTGDPSDNRFLSQRWKIEPFAGDYRIRNVRSDKCIEVAHGSVGDRSRVNQFKCLAANLQYFRFQPALPPPPTTPPTSSPTPTPTPTPVPIEKNQICFDKPIPPGWILIDRQQGHLEGCPNTERFNIQEIQRIDNRPAGEMVIACLGDVPPGWELLGKNIDRTKCGWVSGTANNIMNIRKK